MRVEGQDVVSQGRPLAPMLTGVHPLIRRSVTPTSFAPPAMRLTSAILLLALLATFVARGAETLPRILLYTRNGLTLDGKKGYVHDNIPNSIVAIRALGAQNGFAVDVSDIPSSSRPCAPSASCSIN